MKLTAMRVLMTGVLASGAVSSACAQEATGAGASFPAPLSPHAKCPDVGITI